MSKFLHNADNDDDNNDALAVTVPWVFSENSPAKNAGHSITFFISHNVFFCTKDKSQHMSKNQSVSANPMNLDQSKILLYGQGINDTFHP